MPDLGKLYKRPAGVAMKPKLLPAAEGYIGVIVGHELRSAPQGYEVAYEESVNFQLRPVEWPEDVDAEDRMETLSEGGKPTPIDLKGKTMFANFGDNRLDLLDEFLRGIGIEPKGRGYDEVLAEATGSRVKFDVIWRPDRQNPGEFRAYPSKLRGEESD